MLYLKVGGVIAILWYLTKPSGAAFLPNLGQGCPAGTVKGPWFTCVPVSTGGIGVTVIKTSSECDPTSPIYDPARCSATAGRESLEFDPDDPFGL